MQQQNQLPALGPGLNRSLCPGDVRASGGSVLRPGDHACTGDLKSV